MSYQITWTGHHRLVTTPAQVDEVLDDIERQAVAAHLPLAVTVLPDGAQDLSPFDEDFPDCLEAGVGHPRYAFVRWIGEGGGYGYQPHTDAPAGETAFDYGGQPIFPKPSELRVTPQAARRAIHEFIATGSRPTHLHWQPIT